MISFEPVCIAYSDGDELLILVLKKYFWLHVRILCDTVLPRNHIDNNGCLSKEYNSEQFYRWNIQVLLMRQILGP